MSDDELRFDIDEIVRFGEIVRIRGRCTRGPIVRSDCFSRAYVPVRTYRADGFDEVRTEDRDVQLEIVSIWAYRKEVPECSHGMTAELHAKGTGEDGLGMGYVLEGRHTKRD